MSNEKAGWMAEQDAQARYEWAMRGRTILNLPRIPFEDYEKLIEKNNIKIVKMEETKRDMPRLLGRFLSIEENQKILMENIIAAADAVKRIDGKFEVNPLPEPALGQEESQEWNIDDKLKTLEANNNRLLCMMRDLVINLNRNM